jgi:hypothetical protein
LNKGHGKTADLGCSLAPASENFKFVGKSLAANSVKLLDRDQEPHNFSELFAQNDLPGFSPDCTLGH